MAASPDVLAKLPAQIPYSLAELEAEQKRRKRRKIDTYFPETGPLRRELYVKHLEFFRAGAKHRERLFMAGNRVGKSDTGCFETTLHLTGEYPDWWEGRRFTTPIDGWAASETNALTRDVLQSKLMGPWSDIGSGMIPGDAIKHYTRKNGLADAIDTVFVKHVSGGTSTLGFKAYSEGREQFQAVSRHLVLFDEEPSEEVYYEALLRTMIVPGTTEGGLMLVCFTPLNGYTKVVEAFLNAAEPQ